MNYSEGIYDRNQSHLVSTLFNKRMITMVLVLVRMKLQVGGHDKGGFELPSIEY